MSLLFSVQFSFNLQPLFWQRRCLPNKTSLLLPNQQLQHTSFLYQHSKSNPTPSCKANQYQPLAQQTGIDKPILAQQQLHYRSCMFHRCTFEQVDRVAALESYSCSCLCIQGGSFGMSHRHSQVSLCLKSGEFGYSLCSLLSHHSRGFAKNTCHRRRRCISSSAVSKEMGAADSSFINLSGFVSFLFSPIR